MREMFKEPPGLSNNYSLDFLYPPETKKTYNLPTTNQDNFVNNNKKKITDTLDWLWDSNQSLITRTSTSVMLNLGGTTGIQTDLEENHDNWLLFLYLSAIAGIYNRSGNTFMDQTASTIGATISFNINDPQITGWLNAIAADLKVKLSTTTIRNIESIITLSLREGYNISETSFLLKQTIPVTQREALFLGKLYKNLKDNPDITQKTRQALMKRKALQYKKNRAKRIARTETVRLKHQSEIDAGGQLIKSKNLKRMVKTWRQTNTRDNWNSTLMYDGKTVDLNESFLIYGSPAPTTMVTFDYPNEINEYCVLEYRGIK
jgi:hypothetical protein